MKRILLSTLLIAMLAACGRSQPEYVQAPPPQQVVQQQPDVQYVQAPPQQVVVAPQPQTVVVAPQPVYHDNSGANLVAGMALGMAMSNNSGPRYHDSYQRNTTVVNKTVNVTNVVHQAPPPPAPVAQAPRPTYIPPKPTYTAPATASSFKSVQTSSSFTRSGSNFGGFSRRR